MGRNSAIKLKVTPLQFEKKFIDQEDMSHIPVKLYIQKKNGVGGHTINCIISNPAFEETTSVATSQEGDGKKKHLFGKKIRKGLKTASNLSQGAALGLAMTPGMEEFAPVMEGVALGSSVLAGAGHKKKKVPRYALKAKKKNLDEYLN